MYDILPASPLLRGMGAVIGGALATMACHLGGLDSTHVAASLALPAVVLTCIGALGTTWGLVNLGARLASRGPGVAKLGYAIFVMALAAAAMVMMFAVFHASDAARDRAHAQAASNPTNR